MENQRSQPPVAAQPRTQPGWQPPSDLADWTPEMPRPARLNDQRLAEAICELTVGLRPATTEDYARAMLALIEFVAAFGVPCPDPATVQSIYRETLADLPADLLTTAIARIKTNWTWGNRMPFPAEIRATVADDLSRRKLMLSHAEMVLKKPLPARKDNVISAEQWAELKQRIQRTAPSNRTTKA